MKRFFLLSVLVLSSGNLANAQEGVWSLDACMRYAVENSPKTKQQALVNINNKYDQQSAVASLFPSIGGSVGLQTNFGRSIDPETNTYSNSSNLSNGYELSATLPLFDSGQLINKLKVSKIARMNGVAEAQRIADQQALSTMQAYTDAVYYRKAIEMAKQKLQESNSTLHKARRMEELGLKGKADVAQIEAQMAEDDYNLTHMKNMYDASVITLKDFMNYPVDQTLDVDTLLAESAPTYNTDEEMPAIYEAALKLNPQAIQSEYKLRTSKLERVIARAKLFPSLSLFGGINTYYNKTLTGENNMPAFGTQFRNNFGQWVGISMSIPIFDGLTKRTALNKARVNSKIAEYQREETLRQLQTEIEKALQDREGYAKETVQMEKQVKANEVAYQVTFRKFESGLLSAIDLQTSGNKLLQSQTNLLQTKLKYILKCRLVDYYKGIPIIETK
jgi:outer membrane protein